MSPLSPLKFNRPLYLFPGLTAALFACVAINLMAGSIDIPFEKILEIIAGKSSDSTSASIILNIRAPRILAAVTGGAWLAVSGLLLQVFFKNLIVGPFILGISSGATLMVAFVMLTSLSLGFTGFAPYLTTISAFAGAGAVLAIILVIGSKMKNPITLLIVGLMMGYLCHSITSVLIAFAQQEKVKGFVLWQLGSFAGFKWPEIKILIFWGGPVAVLVYILSKPLNAMLLGEDYAATMGVNLFRFRFFILFCSCGLAGMVTSMAGPVAFIGLAVPHMARLLFATSDNRILIPAVMLTGGIVTGLCDLVARLAFSPVELPVSAVTALFGAPIVIGLLIKTRICV